MQEVTVRRRVPLGSEHLHCGFKTALIEKIRKLSKGECTAAHGYIMEVLELKDVHSSSIADGTLENIFVVTYTANSIKPAEGMVVQGVVSDLDSEDLFVQVEDRFKVMVSGDRLEDAGYTFDNDTYTRGNEVIAIGSLLEVRITEAGYSSRKKRFGSIGTIHE